MVQWYNDILVYILLFRIDSGREQQQRQRRAGEEREATLPPPPQIFPLYTATDVGSSEASHYFRVSAVLTGGFKSTLPWTRQAGTVSEGCDGSLTAR